MMFRVYLILPDARTPFDITMPVGGLFDCEADAITACHIWEYEHGFQARLRYFIA